MAISISPSMSPYVVNGNTATITITESSHDGGDEEPSFLLSHFKASTPLNPGAGQWEPRNDTTNTFGMPVGSEDELHPSDLSNGENDNLFDNERDTETLHLAISAIKTRNAVLNETTRTDGEDARALNSYYDQERHNEKGKQSVYEFSSPEVQVLKKKPKKKRLLSNSNAVDNGRRAMGSGSVRATSQTAPEVHSRTTTPNKTRLGQEFYDRVTSPKRSRNDMKNTRHSLEPSPPEQHQDPKTPRMIGHYSFDESQSVSQYKKASGRALELRETSTLDETRRSAFRADLDNLLKTPKYPGSYPMSPGTMSSASDKVRSLFETHIRGPNGALSLEFGSSIKARRHRDSGLQESREASLNSSSPSQEGSGLAPFDSFRHRNTTPHPAKHHDVEHASSQATPHPSGYYAFEDKETTASSTPAPPQFGRAPLLPRALPASNTKPLFSNKPDLTRHAGARPVARMGFRGDAGASEREAERAAASAPNAIPTRPHNETLADADLSALDRILSLSLRKKKPLTELLASSRKKRGRPNETATDTFSPSQFGQLVVDSRNAQDEANDGDDEETQEFHVPEPDVPETPNANSRVTFSELDDYASPVSFASDTSANVTVVPVLKADVSQLKSALSAKSLQHPIAVDVDAWERAEAGHSSPFDASDDDNTGIISLPDLPLDEEDEHSDHDTQFVVTKRGTDANTVRPEVPDREETGGNPSKQSWSRRWLGGSRAESRDDVKPLAEDYPEKTMEPSTFDFDRHPSITTQRSKTLVSYEAGRRNRASISKKRRERGLFTRGLLYVLFAALAALACYVAYIATPLWTQAETSESVPLTRPTTKYNVSAEFKLNRPHQEDSMGELKATSWWKTDEGDSQYGLTSRIVRFTADSVLVDGRVIPLMETMSLFPVGGLAWHYTKQFVRSFIE